MQSSTVIHTCTQAHPFEDTLGDDNFGLDNRRAAGVGASRPHPRLHSGAAGALHCGRGGRPEQRALTALATHITQGGVLNIARRQARVRRGGGLQQRTEVAGCQILPLPVFPNPKATKATWCGM
jgi:hypothetical protein